MPSKNNILTLGALSNDLYRVAILLNRGSQTGAERFRTESDKRLSEIQTDGLKPYLKKIISQVKSMNRHPDLDPYLADDYLMYSIQLQNYVAQNMLTN